MFPSLIRKLVSQLTLSVKTTPNFQIWYLMSMDVILHRGRKRVVILRAFPPQSGFAWRFQRIPAEHGGVRFGLLLVCHGADVQGGQVHAQQLRDPLPTVDVAVFIQHLQMRRKYSLQEARNEQKPFFCPEKYTHLSLNKLVPVIVWERSAFKQNQGLTLEAIQGERKTSQEKHKKIGGTTRRS